jgi:hypothetical protein
VTSVTGLGAAGGIFSPGGGRGAAANTGGRMGDTVRVYGSGSYLFNLNGQAIGIVKGFSGGSISAEVVTEHAGPLYGPKKHLGQTKYEAISVDLGFHLAQPVYEWIQDWLQTKLTPRDGSIVTTDFNFNAKAEEEFYSALITELSLPACDASAKDAGYLTLKFQPELTRSKKGSGKVENKAQQHKGWITNNYLLQIPGLDCTKVSKIAPITIKQKLSETSDDFSRATQYQPTAMEFPNLAVEIPEVSAEHWTEWFKSFVIEGKNQEADEKDGTLELLSPNLKEVLATLKFYNLGIFKMSMVPLQGHDGIRRLRAEMYCERIEFFPGSPPPPTKS